MEEQVMLHVERLEPHLGTYLPEEVIITFLTETSVFPFFRQKLILSQNGSSLHTGCV